MADQSQQPVSPIAGPRILPDVMTESLVTPICLYCTRFQPSRPGNTCEAFPEGIPAAIWTLRADHHRPFAGDHGIRFTALNPVADREASSIIEDARHLRILPRE